MFKKKKRKTQSLKFYRKITVSIGTSVWSKKKKTIAAYCDVKTIKTTAAAVANVKTNKRRRQVTSP
jgi:hypothetical protein